MGIKEFSGSTVVSFDSPPGGFGSKTGGYKHSPDILIIDYGKYTWIAAFPFILGFASNFLGVFLKGILSDAYILTIGMILLCLGIILSTWELKKKKR